MSLSSRNLKVLTEFSLMKNLSPLTDLSPNNKENVTWDKYKRIRRYLEVWDNPMSIVHRLPKHYQERLWNNLLADPVGVHYRPPKYRYYWDKKRQVEIEAEVYPILPEHCPEQDQGLWGGEGVVKGYYESKPYTKKKILPRQWIPHFWFPALKKVTLYSEILNKHLSLKVTERTMRLIDESFGIDYYLLKTPDMDINSRLGIILKRILLIKLAKADYYLTDQEKHLYILQKYKEFVLPIEEAEWYGYELNDACRKLQDIENLTRPKPLKYAFEQEMVSQLQQEYQESSSKFKDANKKLTSKLNLKKLFSTS